MPTIEKTITTSTGVDEVGRSDTFTAQDTIEVARRGDQTVVTYTAEFAFTGATKLAAPLLAVGLEKIGHDAARQMAECLDRLTTHPSAAFTTTTATTHPTSEDAR
jgi:hypothetical protein